MPLIVILFACMFATQGLCAQQQAGMPQGIQWQGPILTDSTHREIEVDRIFIIGNRLTRDHIILRELSLHSGDHVAREELAEVIEKDRKKLYNTRLFNTVEIRPVELVAGKVDLLINLDERWYTFPAPIFELSDRNFNEWWQNYNHDFRRINYGLRLYQFNMRGRNETLRATMQLGFQRIFSLSYRVPYIDKKQKHGLIFDFDFQESKNIAYRTFEHKLLYLRSRELLQETRGGGISYTYRNSFYNTHAFKVEYRKTTVADTVLQLNDNYFGPEKSVQRFFMLTYLFTADHRDIGAYPLNGSHLQIRVEQKGLGIYDDVHRTAITAGYARFIPLKHKFYFSNYTNGYISFPQNQPYNQYGALGYRSQILRGYEIYVIEGPMYLINKTTFKKLLFAKTYRWEAWPIEQFRHLPIAIYIKSFADVGMVKGYPHYANNTLLTDKLLVGAGGGFDIVSSYDVVLRLEYTFNHTGKGGFFLNIIKEF